jgi:hypothetical protein
MGLFLLILSGQTIATTYYVKPDGNDNAAVRDVLANIGVTDGQPDIVLSLGQGQDPKPQLMGLEITNAAPAPSPPRNYIVR